MCIRDSTGSGYEEDRGRLRYAFSFGPLRGGSGARVGRQWICLLYTSDAADERSSVDLGGRRIIKKKKCRGPGGAKQLSKNKHIQQRHKARREKRRRRKTSTQEET